MELVHRSPNSDEVNQTLITLTNTSLLIAGSHNYMLLPPEPRLGVDGCMCGASLLQNGTITIRNGLTKDRQILDNYAPYVHITKVHFPRLAGPS